jgi:multidrug efflux system outer membrane protein
MILKSFKNKSIIFLSVLVLSACAGKEKPQVNLGDLPTGWSAPTETVTAEISSDWWQSFNSQELAMLVDEAIKGSPDINIAVEKIFQAEEAVGNKKAGWLPSASASASTRGSRNYPSSGSATSSEGTSLGLSVSYEVDVWGRIAAQVRGAKESLKAASYDFDAVKLTLTANVANSYFQLLAIEEQIKYAKSNLEISERILRIVQAKFNNGVALKSELLNQESTVLNRKNTLYSLEEQKKQTLSALAVLTGKAPQGFLVNTESFTNLNVPTVSAGIPSELLLRRPDLASAEAGLAASDANIDAVRANLFPSLSLSGSAGLSTTALLSLMNPASSLSWSAGLAQTLFDGGVKRSQVRISESQKRSLAENYRKTVLTAFKEVEDALNSAYYNGIREEIQKTNTEKLRTSLKLTEARYKEGSETLSSVLDSQTALSQAENQLVDLKLTRLRSAVELYKVLGGGWKAEDSYVNQQ